MYDLPRNFDLTGATQGFYTTAISPVWTWKQESTQLGDPFSAASPLFHDFIKGAHIPMVRIFENCCVHTLWLSDSGPAVEHHNTSPLSHNGTLSIGIQRALWMSSDSGVITVHLLTLSDSHMEPHLMGSYKLAPASGSVKFTGPTAFDETSGRAIIVLSSSSGFQEVYVAGVR